MPIVIAGDNHVAREEQALGLIEAHIERVVVGTPSKLVVQAKDAFEAGHAISVLVQHGFEVTQYTLDTHVKPPQVHYLHITL